MRRFDLWLTPEPEAQQRSVMEARTLRVYESSTGPYLTVIAVGNQPGVYPEGMRLTRTQVIELRNHLDSYLEGTA